MLTTFEFKKSFINLVSLNKAPDVLKADETLVIRKAGKGNDPLLMKKDSYCNTIVMKRHPNTSTYEKVNSNSDIRIFSNLKSLVKNYESFLTKNETKYFSKQQIEVMKPSKKLSRTF